MIEKATGAVQLPSWSQALDPTLKLAEFLSSELCMAASVLIDNGPWRSWDLAPVPSDGRIWYVRVFFHGEALTEVELYASDKNGDKSWGDWSEKKELDRKSYHDGVLMRELGSLPDCYSWGSVASVYDQKGGYSSIKVNYSS